MILELTAQKLRQSYETLVNIYYQEDSTNLYFDGAMNY